MISVRMYISACNWGKTEWDPHLHMWRIVIFLYMEYLYCFCKGTTGNLVWSCSISHCCCIPLQLVPLLALTFVVVINVCNLCWWYFDHDPTYFLILIVHRTTQAPVYRHSPNHSVWQQSPSSMLLSLVQSRSLNAFEAAAVEGDGWTKSVVGWRQQ